MQHNLLEIRNIKKYFPITRGIFNKKVGHVKAVDNVSFDIKDGETFGLVGESGCGKSTTGRVILNLLKPTGGSVKFQEETIFNVEKNQYIDSRVMRKMRQNMQIIFQDPYASLDPRMNIGDIVSEGIIKHGIAKGKDALMQARELLELCGLSASNIKKYPHEFSGGQRQRIGIARALSLKPKFIVCDEPIAALDVSIQAQVLNLMCELKEQLGLTYLFISHDLGVVRYFCDHIGVMYLGTIVESGTSEELFQNQIHPYTQALLSAIPVSDPSMKRDRIILEGEVPSPSNPPVGCKFHTRCKYCTEICREVSPQLKLVEGEHKVACHNYSIIKK